MSSGTLSARCWIGAAILLNLANGLYGFPLHDPGQVFDGVEILQRGEAIAFANPQILDMVKLRDSLPSTSSVYAASTSRLTNRDVYSPKITSPGSSTVWKVGQTVQVTWDTSSPPQHVTNAQGTLYLGHLDGSESNEHLDTANPLAKGFALSAGSVQVQVPSVSPGNDYIVVLMGDSGNRSPTFTIS